jgi:hypothetical protein
MRKHEVKQKQTYKSREGSVSDWLLGSTLIRRNDFSLWCHIEVWVPPSLLYRVSFLEDIQAEASSCPLKSRLPREELKTVWSFFLTPPYIFIKRCLNTGMTRGKPAYHGREILVVSGVSGGVVPTGLYLVLNYPVRKIDVSLGRSRQALLAEEWKRCIYWLRSSVGIP